MRLIDQTATDWTAWFVDAFPNRTTFTRAANAIRPVTKMLAMPSLRQAVPADNRPASLSSSRKLSLYKLVKIVSAISLLGAASTAASPAAGMTVGLLLLARVAKMAIPEKMAAPDALLSANTSASPKLFNHQATAQHLETVYQSLERQLAINIDLPDKVERNKPVLPPFDVESPPHWNDRRFDTFTPLGITLRNGDIRCLEYQPQSGRITINHCSGTSNQLWQYKNNQLRTADGHCIPDDPRSANLSRTNDYLYCELIPVDCSETGATVEYVNQHFLVAGRFAMFYHLYTTPCYADLAYADDFLLDSRAAGPMTFQMISPQHPEWHTLIERNNEKIPYPFSRSNMDLLTLETKRQLLYGLQNLMIPVNVPRIDGFPLAVPDNAPRVLRTFLFSQPFNPLVIRYGAPHNQDSLPVNQKMTGLYAAPGDMITVSVKLRRFRKGCNKRNLDLRLAINLQHNLHDADHVVRTCNCYPRPPFLSREIRLSPEAAGAGMTRIRTAYGGPLSLVSYKSNRCELHITIHGAVEAPYFSTRENENTEDWRTARLRPAPWAILEGKRITTLLTSEQILTLDNPLIFTELLDTITTEALSLFGFETDGRVTDRQHHPGDGNFIIVPDILPTNIKAYVSGGKRYITINQNAGIIEILKQMASGDSDPASTASLKPDELLRASSIAHELGHLLFQPALLDALHHESIAQLTAEYISVRVFNQSYLKAFNAYDTARTKLDNCLSYQQFNDENFDDNRARAVFLAQVIDAYPRKGWRIFSKLARHYRENSDDNNQHLLENGHAMRLDYFFKLLSNITGNDLSRHFRTWGFAISEDALSYVARLPEPATDISAGIKGCMPQAAEKKQGYAWILDILYSITARRHAPKYAVLLTAYLVALGVLRIRHHFRVKAIKNLPIKKDV